MNLRTRFSLLIIGVLVIPLLVMGLSVFFFYYLVLNEDPETTRKEYIESIERFDTIEQFTEMSKNLGEQYFFLISEVPEIVASTADFNDYFSLRWYSSSLRGGSKRILYFKTRLLRDGSEIVVLLGINYPGITGRVLPLLFLGTTLLVLIILSLLIIRSINKSIDKLKTATGRIAQGDLDFDLDTSGSDSFGSLSRSLDKMRCQIKMEYDRRNRFFMGISHDLKTPLSSIIGYTAALSEGMTNDQETVMKFLGIINKKSHQLEHRITHLIHYIKLSTSDFRENLSDSSLSIFLDDFLKVQQEEAEFNDKLLKYDVNIPDSLILSFDKDLLGRALENLLNNGFKYGRTGEPITLRCSTTDKIVEILIESNSPAISEKNLPLIFEPFFRGDKSRKGNGFGLGLASVKSIIDSHGWYISAESDKQKTTFCITIPLTPDT